MGQADLNALMCDVNRQIFTQFLNILMSNDKTLTRPSADVSIDIMHSKRFKGLANYTANPRHPDIKVKMGE